MNAKHWLAILGQFTPEGSGLVFKGGATQIPDRPPGVEIGNFVSDVYFGGGVVSAAITFHEAASAAGLILYYHPATGAFVQAQLGGPALVGVRTWMGQEWAVHAQKGLASQLQPDRSYDFRVSVSGSRVTVTLDGILLLETNLPTALPHGQVGIWAMGLHDISFASFDVEPERPRLFVIMQYTDQFNDLYKDVIKPVGENLGLAVVRADDTYGPGIIIADIERQILDASAIIADVTPVNANVFWEVGYAHAMRKPTILIAERAAKLPFDVSPFRVLFYDNTIAGKARIEDGLRKHMAAIQSAWTAA